MKNYILLFLAIILMAADCKNKNPDCSSKSHDSITIINNSGSIVNFKINWNYPDTILDEYKPFSNNIISSNSRLSYGAGIASCWESNLGQSKAFFNIFDQDSLQVIPWEIVRKTNRGLLERRVIDIDYLNKNNFTITYP